MLQSTQKDVNGSLAGNLVFLEDLLLLRQQLQNYQSSCLKRMDESKVDIDRHVPILGSQ